MKLKRVEPEHMSCYFSINFSNLLLFLTIKLKKIQGLQRLHRQHWNRYNFYTIKKGGKAEFSSNLLLIQRQVMKRSEMFLLDMFLGILPWCLKLSTP